MISVAEYDSYRRYLKDVLAEQKANNRDVTVSSFAKQVGLSASGLQMILDGSRNLTVHKVHSVADGLRLSDAEHERFETLVHFEQAESPREKKYYEARLRAARTTGHVKTARVSDRDLLADWFLPAFLIYLVDLAPDEKTGELRLDYPLLQKELGLTRGKVDELLDLLTRRGVLRIRKAERVHIIFDKVAGDLSKKRFLLKVLEEMRRRIDHSFSDPHSYFQGHTFTLSASDFESFVADYKSLLDRYIAKGGDAAETTRVFQTLFCVSAVL